MSTVTVSNKKTISVTNETLLTAHTGVALIVLELQKAISYANVANRTSDIEALTASKGNATRALDELTALVKS